MPVEWLNSKEFLLSSAKFEPLKRCGFCICLSCLNQNSIHWPSQARLYDTIQAVIQVSVQLNSKRSTDRGSQLQLWQSMSGDFRINGISTAYSLINLNQSPIVQKSRTQKSGKLVLDYFYAMYACSQFNNKIISYNLKWKKQEPNCN